jgi:HD-like signal output (HDOD) protein
MAPDPELQVSAAQLVARASELATLPDIYFRIKQILDDSTSSHEDVADALATDPALAGRLLRLANSAFYGRPGTIATISRAVGLLGTQQVHDLVLTTAVVHAFGNFSSDLIDQDEFWRSSLFAGSAAKILAEQCDILDCERLFVGGLLAQVGQLILYQELPEQMRSILRDAGEQDIEVAALQRDRLGFDYAQLSAELFNTWQLPAELVMPIRDHTQSSSAEEARLEAAIIHIAVLTAIAQSTQQSTRELIPRLDDHAWHMTALSLEKLEQIRQDALALSDEIIPVLLSTAA